jgi:hypothetical protein
MVYVEPEKICHLEHFLRGELESGVGAPFQRYIHISPSSAVDGSQESLVLVEEEGRNSNVRPRLIHTPPGFSNRYMLLRKSITFSEMSMKNNVTTASNSPSWGKTSKKSPSTSLTALFGQWSGTVRVE